MQFVSVWCINGIHSVMQPSRLFPEFFHHPRKKQSPVNNNAYSLLSSAPVNLQSTTCLYEFAYFCKWNHIALSFGVWLISLITVFSGFIHVVAFIRLHLFLWLIKYIFKNYFIAFNSSQPVFVCLFNIPGTLLCIRDVKWIKQILLPHRSYKYDEDYEQMSNQFGLLSSMGAHERSTKLRFGDLSWRPNLGLEEGIEVHHRKERAGENWSYLSKFPEGDSWM